MRSPSSSKFLDEGGACISGFPTKPMVSPALQIARNNADRLQVSIEDPIGFLLDDDCFAISFLPTRKCHIPISHRLNHVALGGYDINPMMPVKPSSPFIEIRGYFSFRP